MLKRGYRKEESLARHWAEQAIDLCVDIDDEELNELIPPIKDAIKALERDRRVIFIGESGCGKTSLLAGLAQYPSMPKSPLKEDYHSWRYRNSEQDTPHADNTSYIPMEDLEGLELVDTADCKDESRTDTLVGLMRDADVVIAVADARSCETSSIWQMLMKLTPEQRKECLITITHTDLLPAETALTLKDKLRDFCAKNLASVPAVYLISPTTMKGLEGFALRVQECLNAKHGVKGVIRKIIDNTCELLNRQSRILRAREEVSKNDNGFLSAVDQEIDHFLNHQLTGLKTYVDMYAEATLLALPQTISKFNKTFGYWLSPVTLVRMELFGAGTEKYYYHMLSNEILTRQESSDKNFILSCSGHWRNVRPRMKKAMECEIGEFPEQELGHELHELRRRLGRDLYRPFTKNNVRRNIAQAFNQCTSRMKFFTFLICILLIVAGVFGFLGNDVVAYRLVIAAAVAWGLGSLAHLSAARLIRKEVIQQARLLQDTISETLGEDMQQLLISRVAAYRKLYAEPRRKVARHDAMLKPLQQKHLNILREINSILPR